MLRPTHLPWLCCSIKPAGPWPMPQTSAPRALMASRSLPACAVPTAPSRSAAAMPAAMYLLTIRFFPSWLPLAPGRPPGVVVRRREGAFLGDRIGWRNGAGRPSLTDHLADQRRSRLRDVKGLVLHGSTPCCGPRGHREKPPPPLAAAALGTSRCP